MTKKKVAPQDPARAVPPDVGARDLASTGCAPGLEDCRALLDALPVALAVAQQGAVVCANRALAALLGVADAREILGWSALALVHPDDHAAVRAPGPAPGERFQELRVLRRDGGVVHAEVAAVPAAWQGAPAMLVVLRDVGERRRLQSHLVMADLLASVGTLAAGAAHEVNNPLTYVIFNLDFASQGVRQAILQGRTRGDDDDDASLRALSEVEQALDDAREGAERVRAIVRDLKTFSRVDEEQRGLVDVRKVMESSISMAWSEVRYRARLVRLYDPEVPRVEANEGRLGQVFLNLLLNATQAIPDGDAERHEIRVVIRNDASGRVAVEVHDTGVGIAPENLGRLFDPFFTTKPQGVGTGLGLSVCHGIVSTLGGEVRVESELGAGSVFTVLLPAATSERRPARPSSHPVPPSARTRILVVDDEPHLLGAIRRMLSSLYDVATVTRARDALTAIVAGDRYDVILCDLMMPEMTGMDLHAELTRHAPEQAARMVFLTGGAFTLHSRDFLERVTNPRLEKPFDLSRLQEIIKSFSPE